MRLSPAPCSRTVCFGFTPHSYTHSYTHDITIASSSSLPTGPNHYNPHSGFDAVSALQSTAKEPDHPYIYISLFSIIIVRPLLGHNLHCSCHPHTGSLVLRFPSLFYGGCLFGSMLPRGRFCHCHHPCSYYNIHGRGGTGATSGDVDVPEGDDPLWETTPICAPPSRHDGR